MMRGAGFAGGALAGALGLGIVAVLSVGVAAAANGGSLTLGQTNTATSTTTLKDKHGTPLTLVGSSTKSPLKVNSSKEVAHLNASAVGGKSAGSLETSGSDGHLYNSNGVNLQVDPGVLPFLGQLVVATAPLAKGTYFVTATAWVDATGASTGKATHCYIGQSNNSSDELTGSVTDLDGNTSLSMTWPVTLKSAGKLGEFCYTEATSATVYWASIVATRISHATVGTNVDVVPTGIHPITSH